MALTLWHPDVGPELARFCGTKNADFAQRLESESIEILSRCIKPGTSPSEESRRAGIVIGLVQSGKTSSFTAVTALARDNDFNLIIIVAGTTKTLQDQTYARLERDLELDDLSATARWSLLKNPAPANDSGNALRSRIAEHLAADAADMFDLAVPIVVVMKQHTHLNNLNALLGQMTGLDRITALIIDDEAHMHSPNVAKEPADESATYARIRTLRAHLPVHTFLQYTATPQANLLAHITDELSPEFVYFLDPGDGYTGGEYFFINHRDTFTRRIPAAESYALDPDEFMMHGPPPSLRRAFLTFVVSCAADRAWKRTNPMHNTMLVHPHSTTNVHAVWHNAINAMRDSVLSTLEAPEHDPDRQLLISKELGEAWKDLERNNPDLPPLDELLRHIKTVLNGLQIRLLNSRKNETIPWRNQRYWVIVGGNILGVGFTVEGLRTTHMMRSVGVGLADTIQQRGRFFGYKASYQTMCRAWLQEEVEDAFVDYVQHETELRRSLQDYVSGEQPLQDWKRVFFLDPRFKPTRTAAWRITMEGYSPNRQGWTIQQWLSLEEAELELLAGNWSALDHVLTRPFHASPEISGATPNSTHEVATCSLADIQDALIRMRFPGADANRFAALRLLLARIAESDLDESEDCAVVSIANLRQRVRTPNLAPSKLDGTIVLHQGRSPGDDPNYDGDAEARDPDRITLQVHNVHIGSGDETSTAAGNATRAFPFVALYLPPPVRAHLLVEANA